MSREMVSFTARLSKRQRSLLETFAQMPEGEFMSYEDAHLWDQRPFRSLLIQGWIVYRSGRGFHCTREGRRAWQEFTSFVADRKNHSAPLTAFFDAVAYGLEARKTKAKASAA